MLMCGVGAKSVAHLMKFYLLQWEVMKVKFLINSNMTFVISHFPKKRGCPKNRFHNGAMLLLFISKQAEPAFLSKITIGQSQQPIKGKVFHRSSELWSWAHSHFTLGLQSIETSKF